MNKVLHNLLSIFIPFFSICAVYSYISSLFPSFRSLTPGELSIVLITGLVCQLIFVITRKERVSSFSYIRLFILMYIIFWAFLLVLNKGSIKERLTPTLHQGILILMLGMQYVWAVYLSNLFFEYEQFLEFCRDYKGTELFSKLREQGEITSSSGSALRLSVILSFIPIIIICAISIVLGRDFFPISSVTLLFSAVSCFFSALTYAYVSLTKEERFYAGQGLESVFDKSRDRFRFALVIIVISAVTAFFYAKPDALFTENGQTPFYIAFLAWLIKLLGSRERKHSDLTLDIPEYKDAEPAAESDVFIPLEGVNENIDLSWITDIIKILSLIILAVLFLTAVFGPFLKKDWKDFWKEKKLLKYLMMFFKSFKEFIKTLFFPVHNEKPLVVSEAAGKLTHSLAEFAHLKKSKEKKAEIGRLSKKYIELCVWGETAGSACTAATAPFEYAQQLYMHTGWYKQELFTIAELFEKALFSASLISEEEEKEFYKLIENITSLSLDKTRETIL